jgi:hypothetical protein
LNDELKYLVVEYIENVNKVCFILAEGLNIKSKREFWDYRAIHHKIEFTINGYKYNLHGRGCRVTNNNFFIDWDFGYGSRWCGIEPWLLARTLKENKDSRFEFYDGNRILEECEKAVLSGEMTKKHDLYYFTIPIEETFVPSFPKEYDTLIIEHYNSRWIIKRNKKIEKFIRKSPRVSRHTLKGVDSYVLRFINEEKEVFTIFFDDIAYPEKAVMLMSEIMKENYKEHR